MAPTIEDGDRVLVAPAPPESLRPGHIVKFRAEGAFLMHRRVWCTRDDDGTRTFVLRGDYAPAPDPPVATTAIIGLAIAVERHGVQRRLDSRFELWKGRLKILKRSLIERWQGGALILIPALAALLSLGAFAAVAHSNDSRDERDAKTSKLQIATL